MTKYKKSAIIASVHRKEESYMDKYKRHKELAEELSIVYQQKNHDYGDSFGKTFKALGLISAVTRITDKYNRLVSLATGHKAQVQDESIIDTLKDMANYCLMTVIELEEQEGNGNAN